MRTSSRRFPLVRAALASAIAGHWLANALADPGEYARVGLEYSGRALLPIAVQTLLVLSLIGLATALSRRRPHPARTNLSPVRMAMILAGSQLALSWLFEATERLTLSHEYVEAFEGGWLASEFGLELLVALVSAVILVVLARAVGTLVRVLLARRQRPAPSPEPRRFTHRQAPRHVRHLVGAGAVRAPPA